MYVERILIKSVLTIPLEIIIPRVSNPSYIFFIFNKCIIKIFPALK